MGAAIFKGTGSFLNMRTADYATITDLKLDSHK